jgi:hypothetical protein
VCADLGRGAPPAIAERMIVTTLTATVRWRVAGPQLHVAMSVGQIATNPGALCILVIRDGLALARTNMS